VGLYWENPRDLKEVPRAIALASFLMTAYVIVQKLKLDPIQWRDSNGLPPTFPVGTMGNSNFAGGFLAVASPMFLYVVLSARKSWRWVLAAAFALDLLALWFTQTRGALIGVGLAIAALAFCSRDKLPRWMRLTALAGVIGAGLVFVVVVVHPGMKQAPSVFSQAGALSPFRTGTFQDRSNYWVAGLRIFKRPTTRQPVPPRTAPSWASRSPISRTTSSSSTPQTPASWGSAATWPCWGPASGLRTGGPANWATTPACCSWRSSARWWPTWARGSSPSMSRRLP
jgi:hypothetical protein